MLVAYDGFNPGEPETEFVSPMDEARRLGDYVVEHYGGKIDILYGISYGCRVLMEVLADKHLTVTTTIADGMGLRDYPNIKSKWGKDVYCFSSRDFSTRSWAIPARGGRDSLPKFRAERSRRPSASSTAGRRGKAGGIRTIT